MGGGNANRTAVMCDAVFIFKYIFRLFSYCCLRSSVKGKRPPPFPPPPAPAPAVTPCMSTVWRSGPWDCSGVRGGGRLPEQTWFPPAEDHGGPVGLTLVTDVTIGEKPVSVAEANDKRSGEDACCFSPPPPCAVTWRCLPRAGAPEPQHLGPWERRSAGLRGRPRPAGPLVCPSAPRRETAISRITGYPPCTPIM